MARGFNWNRVRWHTRIQQQGYEVWDEPGSPQSKQNRKRLTKNTRFTKTAKRSPLVFEWNPPRV